MIDWQIVIPIPVPADFVVKNGSKIRSLSFSPIPVPASAMETIILFDSRTIFDLIRNTRERFGRNVHRFDCVRDQILKDLPLQLASISE